MDSYDAVQIKCKLCGKVIGMVERDAEIVFTKCGNCANPLPEGDDILYSINKPVNSQ
jgi:translation initiation factor 2 beta subunit (eIF-2beta)/eIF-5